MTVMSIIPQRICRPTGIRHESELSSARVEVALMEERVCVCEEDEIQNSNINIKHTR